MGSAGSVYTKDWSIRSSSCCNYTNDECDDDHGENIKNKSSDIVHSTAYSDAYDVYNQDLPDVINWDDATPFIAPLKFGKVIKVYDGDTLTIAARLPMPDSPLYRFQIRLDGIDTPEIRGKTKDEKDMAQLAKHVLTDLLINKTIYLEGKKTEKYGRTMAKVYFNGICINDWLIDNRYAVPYDGGTKKTPRNWRRYKKTGKMGRLNYKK
jgi:micrococcal nuclease